MIKKLKYLRRFYGDLANENDRYRCVTVTEASELLEAQRLHARVYRDKGYVKDDEIGLDGTLHEIGDPYKNHAHYFAVKRLGTNKIVASSRLIYAPKGQTLKDFQTFTHLNIWSKVTKHLLSNYNASECLEVSALVKIRGESLLPVLMLYREMWQYSLNNGCKIWLMSCNAELFSRLKLLFGDAVQAAGPPQHFRNFTFVPATLEIEPSLVHLAVSMKSLNPVKRHISRRIVRFFLSNLSEKSLSTLESTSAFRMIR